MAPPENIVFYTSEYSPFAQRVHITLEEAHVPYTAYQIDTSNKPEWYSQVNALGKIPAITFGGPNAPPDQPSPLSTTLAHLLPHDPLLRARARVFVEIYRNYVHDQFRDVFFLGKPIEGILAALEKLQRALPVERGFAAGEWSIADAAVAPSVVRLKLFLREGLGAFTEEDLQRLRDAMASEKFARFAQYVQDVSERPSFKKTWVSDERQLQVWGKHPGLRQRKTAAAASSGGTQA
ncbi:thioredoxin-like protein [Cubamyces sp. BRFM 1775]|nr:thioredoxin-like protein [Cubamyces sp. BRFM 1775]